MDFKRKETKTAEIQPDGHIEQRIVNMAEMYPEISLTGLVYKLSESTTATNKIAAVGIKYAVKVIGKIINESADQNEFSDGDIIDKIYDKL